MLKPFTIASLKGRQNDQRLHLMWRECLRMLNWKDRPLFVWSKNLVSFNQSYGKSKGDVRHPESPAQRHCSTASRLRGTLLNSTTTRTNNVAVAPKVSVLLALKIMDVTAENSTTATLTVTRLFVKFSCNRIINIGTTRLKPPVMVTMNLASLSTNGDISTGASPYV